MMLFNVSANSKFFVKEFHIMGIKKIVNGTQSIQRALGLLRLIADHQAKGLRFVDIIERSGL
jgi:hypothetical protein